MKCSWGSVFSVVKKKKAWQFMYGLSWRRDLNQSILRHQIHKNPVRAEIVEKEEEYLLSSCRDFYGIQKGPIELTVF